MTQPSYLEHFTSGELLRRVARANDVLARCSLCPRACGVDRSAGARGFCRADVTPMVASWNAHPWEEPPVSGVRGSGTIFFSHCTGRCLFCQNYPISQLGAGKPVSIEDLAGMMLELQKRGCHNINFVTPTHYVPQILSALPIAIRRGFHLPLVYNTSGYDVVETLRLLDGIVDIYIPDAKYADDGIALELSGFVDYVQANHAALREMHRQVGDDLALDDQGIAQRGMIVRHLVLPHGLAGTAEVFRWLAGNLSRRIHVSVMDQYFPAHQAVGHPLLGRTVTSEEYIAAMESFDEAGLERGWWQEHSQDAECPVRGASMGEIG